MQLSAFIIRFTQLVETVSQLRNDLTQDRRLLGREYPDHITVGLRDWQDSECNFGAMAADRAFRNDFADTLRRYGAYANSVVAPLDSGQRDLHALLDARLGIVH